MNSWKKIGLDSYRAAPGLRTEKEWRSCVSRSYYALYSVVTHELVKKKVKFRHGMKNPSHDALPMLIRTYLTFLSLRVRERLASIASRMLNNRVDADYRPSTAVDFATSIACLSDVAEAFKLIGVM